MQEDDSVAPAPAPAKKPAKKKTAEKEYIIPRTIFRRCVKELGNDIHITAEAIDLLQQETERHVVSYLGDVARVAENAGRETVLMRDTVTVKEIYTNKNSSGLF